MTSNRWFLPAFLATLALGVAPGCGGDDAATDGGDDADAGDVPADDADAGPDPLTCEPRTTPLPLDEIPPAGEAVAGRATRAEELIGGEVQLAQPGRAWKAANHEVAFVVQGGDANVGYTVYGGSLLAADLQRADGVGQNTFRELVPIVAFRMQSADEVSVLCDGNGGRAAVIRVEGVDAPSQILPQLDGIARPLGFRIITDYIVEPDARELRIRTTIFNDSARTWASVAMADLVFFGSAANTSLGPECGFGDIASVQPSYLVTASDPAAARRGVSYGYAAEYGQLDIPIFDWGAGGLVGRNVHTLVRGDSTTFERRLTVGRDLSDALQPLLEYLDRPYAAVSGTVADPDGPVAAAAVVAFPAGVGRAASSATTGADGSYRLVVEPGSYDLVVAKAGHARGTGSTGTLAAGDTASVDLTLDRPGAVTLDIRDDTTPVPAKVTLYGIDVEAKMPAVGPIRGERENMGANEVFLSPDGAGTFPAKPGRYRAVVSRGPEWGIVEQEIDVPAGGAATLSVTLEHRIDTTDWIGGDFHVHTMNSPDGRVTVCERVAEGAAEGLDLLVATDHEGRTDYGPCVAELGLAPFLATMIGAEVSNMGTGGHRNAYPLPYDPTDPLRHAGPQYWATLDSQELNDKIHAEADGIVIQMNHPRSTDSYMNWSQWDPISRTVGRTGETLADGWNAMETSNGSDFPFRDVTLLTPERDAELQELARSADRGSVPDWADYLSFIVHGWRVTAMGTSDVHGRNDGTGYARSYLHLRTDDPTVVTDEVVTAAIFSQQVLVSNGVFLRVVTEGIEAMGPDEVVPVTDGQVEMYVQVEALPEFDVSYLYVFANGRPLYLRRGTDAILADDTAADGGTPELALLPEDALDEIVRLATEIRHVPTGDTYYHVLVRGIGDMDPLPSNEPFAYTNGIYVHPE